MKQISTHVLADDANDSEIDKVVRVEGMPTLSQREREMVRMLGVLQLGVESGVKGLGEANLRTFSLTYEQLGMTRW